MTGKTKVTKTISLYLNFNNENQYHFAIKLPRRTYQEDFWYLTAVNSVGEGFALASLARRGLRRGTFHNPCTAKNRAPESSDVC